MVVEPTIPTPRLTTNSNSATVVSYIKYNCGCGVRPEDWNAALEHARTTGHTVGVVGEIRHSLK